MTLGDRLQTLRNQLAFSQKKMGSQGFVSIHGWVKLEKGQRSPSDDLIKKLTAWLVRSKYIRMNAAAMLEEELLTLKYLTSRSSFIRRLAMRNANDLVPTEPLTLAEKPELYKVEKRRFRTMKAKKERIQNCVATS